MLVQVLAEYADRYLADQLEDAAWESKPVPWELNISRQGNFLNVTERKTVDTSGKKPRTIDRPLTIPRSPVNRNSGEHPLLAADDIAYVLGAGAWSGAKVSDLAKAQAHHEAFVALIRKAAEETQLPELEACARFYANATEVDKARDALKAAKTGAIVALSAGQPLVNLEPARDWWRRHYQAEFEARMEGEIGECLVSGRTGPVAPTHEKIKGLASLGGQAAGVSLMSFDKEAFRSYGWERNANSPVSPDRALAYVLALNDLLRPGGSASTLPGERGKVRRRDVAGVGFIFWTRESSDFDLQSSLFDPDESVVKALLSLDEVHLDTNRFYLTALSGNGGRLRVRCWVADSLGKIQRNLAEWHRQLRVEWPWEDRAPVRIWQLENVLDRDGEPPAHHTLALVGRAIEGRAQPLGYPMLAAALNRLRHPESASKGERRSSDARPLTSLRISVGLVRICVNDILHRKGAKEMSEGLDESCALPAYLCGRLMYVYENLQREANGAVNSSVIDRYFTLASTNPSRAFPALKKLGNAYLRKLRRDNGGAATNLDKLLGEIHFQLQPDDGMAYPKQLSLEGQGLFILGYYHQKSASIREAIERGEAKKLAASTQNPSESSETPRRVIP
ncbi:MAG: type I-C CRISPR-associated protein Cas8c/Csd1 [Terracidiphilus sp.]